jgi:hypothetical protein
MEVLLLHRPRGQLSPELMKASMEIGKHIMAKGNSTTYIARNQMLIICLADVPSLDSVIPSSEQMNMVGWDTEIIPIEKAEDATPKFEKALMEMMKK